MVQSRAHQQLYTHAAEPKAIQQRRAKYRDEDVLSQTANIMFDRRVVRGNTYAARILPAEPLLSDTKKPPASVRTKAGRTAPPRTPEPVEGRRHMDIQTDTYLEELSDTITENDANTQTDAFLDRPPTPLFVPQKTGIDAVTQILNGDLFDFDFEVEPILEVLVGKVLEQGLMEVLEEEELEAMRAHQEHFEQIRNAELVATQRMEAAEKRKLEEKERRVAQERERVERERVVRQKVAASTFARGYLSGVLTSVFNNLQSSGFFYDPVHREVETTFMPWLKDAAVRYLSEGLIARQCIKQLVNDATRKLALERAEAQQRQQLEQEAMVIYKQQDQEAANSFDFAMLEAIRKRAHFVLHELKPPPVGVSPDKVQEVLEKLKAAAEAEADAVFEAAKAAAAEAMRAEAEAKRAEQQAQLVDTEAQGDDETPEGDGGEEAPRAEGSAQPPEEPLVDVEAAVAAAVEAVQRPPVKSITDGDVLSAMIESGDTTRDAIIQAMAINSIGADAFINHPLYNQPEPENEPAPVPTKGRR